MFMTYRRFQIIAVILSELCAPEIYEMLLYKPTEAIEYVKISLLFNKNTNVMGNNSKIHRIKNVKFSGLCFYMNPNI